MATRRDIVVTWPKTKPLRSYLIALVAAQANGEQINYRVARRPYWEFGALRERPARCYRVHDGWVRGFTDILWVCHRTADEVKDVDTGGHWPEGTYIACSPVWHAVVPYPMRGFQGWRWYDYLEHMAKVESGAHRP